MATVKIKGEKESVIITEEEGKKLLEELNSGSEFVTVGSGRHRREDVRSVWLEGQQRKQVLYTNVELAEVPKRLEPFKEPVVVNGRKLFDEEQYLISMGALKVGEHGEFIVTNPTNYRILTGLLGAYRLSTMK